LKQFDEADAFDIDKQLLAAGLPLDLDKNSGEIAQEQLESLYQKLNDEEKQSFTRLADDMFSEQMGFNMSCFKKK
jgi:hypothetical protein